jgi:hypothetical protein
MFASFLRLSTSGPVMRSSREAAERLAVRNSSPSWCAGVFGQAFSAKTHSSPAVCCGNVKRHRFDQDHSGPRRVLCDIPNLGEVPDDQVAEISSIVSALIALSVLAGIAAPASAFDTKGFYQDLDRRSGGTAN